MADKQLDSKSQDHLDDSQLIVQTLKGNPKSFEVLVRRYQKLVYNVVYKMTGNSEIAADSTQETFLKVYRALDKFDLSKSFRPWILKIARNTTLTLLKKRQFESTFEDTALDNIQSSSNDPSFELEQKQTQTTFANALNKLPQNQMEVFLLKYQHELSYNEINEITGLSVSSIKSLFLEQEKV